MSNFPQQQKKHKAHKETVKYSPFKGKKLINRNYPWKRRNGGSTREFLKQLFYRCSKKLKENLEKIKEMMYEQNGNINKEIQHLKKNSRAKSTIIEVKVQGDSKVDLSR